ncbi:AT hook motif DNA-binding family protein [Striga asiatica]|uniref:AT-hook motif nuclear-localized protein n=1 Tax=Striga asiatica TaxID=4170 RepID=A0A5A7PRT4_STRAF|nr:AT hook motif DNA-binding family protein [Striga asiatica]
MDSQDSSAPPPHANHHHHHLYQHHHPQPPLPPHHAVLMGPHSQPQLHPPNMPYPLPAGNNNSAPTAAANAQPMMHQQNPRFPFSSGPPAPKPTDHQYSDGSPSASGGGWFNIEPAKKKRGRPRKYSPDNSIGLGLSPAPAAQISPSAAAGGGHLDSGGGASADTSGKRNRGRPPGSVKKQLDALGVPGVGFTPHVITVEAGEDISSTVMAFAQQGPRTVCILSANGAVCNVTLRQPAMSGGTVTYEGRFEIISLSGSFVTSESNGAHSKSGGLSVSLAGTDGRVLGGGVAGMLKAASLVQVVVGSFIAEGKKSKTGPSSSSAAAANNNTPPSSNMLNFGPRATEASSSSPGASSESGEDNDDNNSRLHHQHSSGAYPNAGRPVQNMPMYSNMGWPNSMKMHPH